MINLGKHVYIEWLIPICDYFEVLRKEEKNLEIRLPFLIAFIAASICWWLKIEMSAVYKLNSLLPNVLAILIGFCISAVSIIASSTDANSSLNKLLERTVNSRQITFKQWFLINLIYYIFCETFFLLLTFSLPLIIKIITHIFVYRVVVFLYSYLLLRIMFGIIKTITQLYFVYFKDGQNNKINN